MNQQNTSADRRSFLAAFGMTIAIAGPAAIGAVLGNTAAGVAVGLAAGVAIAIG
jgi:hypothetical protein